MLKVFKHDFLENYLSIIGALLFLILGWILGQQRLTIGIFFLPMGGLILIVLLFIATMRSTQQKLFGPEGYLTFSLPVGIDALLCAKIAINLIWILLSLGVFVLLFCQFSWTDFPESWAFMLKKAGLFSLFYLLLYLKLLLVLTLLHMGKFKRFKKIAGLVLFIAVESFLQLPSILLEKFQSEGGTFPYSSYFESHQTIWFFTGEGVKILFLYGLIRWLLVHKLELE
ncbi:hypothetical protein [Helicobacter suis]|uniref:Conserved hypothetical membrane protein n=1 Tax=Helicobacter suis TaxID=104628 RepID=A0A6J4CZL0_9HELI|nr:hypothetical protein [Helicobacter suis]BCD46468.1 Conserved hypothetical membrane protein [Helicobacter suis]BCD49377.1 Conserved hypothetical membrane protein [Helicobacter suis]BCD70801.1 Conserved hypothetical membrane protein [Helicobacter suis]GFK16489.1 Conserved hypothetical membrane protein [Helicobacter suis]